MATDSLKLPPIPVPRGRSPGSSPDVRRRSKEREQQQRKLRNVSLRLPRLFRGRSMSTAASAGYLARSLTNLTEIGGHESPDDLGLEFSPSSSQHSRKTSRNQESYKWPVVKTLSAASVSKQHHHHHLHETSASSTPGGRRSPKQNSPQQVCTPTSLTAPSAQKPRSQSHSHRFPFNFTFNIGNASSGDHKSVLKNVHDSKGNWIGFVQTKQLGPDGRPLHAWSNKNTFFTRARSADDILQLYVDDDTIE